ncbi:hypothetical protein EB241_01165 [Erwinia psidii]|uniref:Uncharacterized protein n=1 Tax=Erwinia psidii TaxID=69224 RepID=A0A3N6SJ34_9GAMM|nr:hypothetical protein EB241_01165 [Erwinia psidii]
MEGPYWLKWRKKSNQTISVLHEVWFIDDEYHAGRKFCLKAKKSYKKAEICCVFHANLPD